MLTTKEFIKEVEKLELKTSEVSHAILIYYGYCQVASVYKNELFSADTAYAAFDGLAEELRGKLYNLIDAYARTPLEDREEPQKVYLRHKWLKNIDNHKCYLNRFLDRYYFLGNLTENSCYKTQFTQAEIDEIKEKLNVSLEDFEQIPVEEDEEIE